MRHVFQKAQNDGFWNFDFWFLSRGKKGTVNYCLYEFKHIITKNWKNQSIPHATLCVASKCVCNITAERFIGWGKNG